MTSELKNIAVLVYKEKRVEREFVKGETVYHVFSAAFNVEERLDMSNVEFYLGEKKVSDHAEIQIGEYSILDKEYGEREIRMHIMKLYSALYPESNPSMIESPSIIAEEPTKKAINMLAVSPWNPPTLTQQLRGDIMYLMFETIEGTKHHVTASKEGFYMTNTNEEFSVEKTSQVFRSLRELISSVSEEFKSAKLRESPVYSGFEKASWMVPEQMPTKDSLKGLGKLFGQCMLDASIADQFRDWNEEMQQCKEQGAYRQLTLLQNLFAQQACVGVQLILNGSLSSMFEDEQLYFWNNIFFSPVESTMDRFMNNLNAAYITATKEHQGAVAMSSFSEISMMPACVIDVFDKRFTAQALVPGILGCLKVIYGLSDNELHHTHEMHGIYSQIAAKMFWKEHLFQDKMFYPSSDVKAIKAYDGRYYVFEASRVTPIDFKFLNLNPNYHHDQCFLRFELLKLFTIPAYNMDATEPDEDIQALLDFLYNVQIPAFAKCTTFSTGLMHSYGINTRHLGIVYEISQNDLFKRRVALEMVSRAYKNLIRHQKTSIETLSEHLSVILQTTSFGPESNGFLLEIYNRCSTMFNIKNELQVDSLPLFREICLKLGIQMKQGTHERVEVTDILNFAPICKFLVNRSEICENTFLLATGFLNQNQLEKGVQTLEQACNLYESIYPMNNIQSLHAHSLLAEIYNLDKSTVDRALRLQKYIVRGYEKTTGFDSMETIGAYFALSSMMYNRDDVESTFSILTHILTLKKFHCESPEFVPLYSLFARTLMRCDLYKDALVYWEKCLEMTDTELTRASIFHLMSRCVFNVGDMRKGVDLQRKAFIFFSSNLGKDDLRTKEASKTLDEMVQRTVEILKKK